MKVCMVIPPKVEGKYIHREDKHVSMHDEIFVPYTAPLHYALIKQEIKNVEISLIEAQRDDLSLENVLLKLDEINPDIVVTYLGWVSIPWDRKVAETKYPTIAIIVQQWIDQMEAVKMYELKNRYTLFKEIEAPLIETLKEFQSSRKVENASGVIVNHNNSYKLTSMPNLFDMSKLPLPDFKSFELEKYFEIRKKYLPAHRVKMAYLNTMKSCPYKCSFCGQSNDGTKVRYQSADYVVSQLKFLNEEYGITKFEFIDNVHTTSKRRAKELAEKIISENLKIEYSVNDRLGRYDKELAELMKQSGCFEVRVGIETIDPKLQELMNKKLNIDIAKQQLEIIHNAGMMSYLYFVTGIPGETKESINMNARFVVDTNANNFVTGQLFIMPASPLYDKFKKEGKLLLDEWSEYRKFDKLTYKTETYKSLDDIKKARNYFKKRVYFFKMLQFKNGPKHVIYYFMRFIARVNFFDKISFYIPIFIKEFIKSALNVNRR